MDRQPDEAADDRAVDADILQIAADGVFKPASDGIGIPGAHRFGNQPDNAVAIIGRHAHCGAADEAVDRRTQTWLVLQRLAQLTQRIAELAGKRRVGPAHEPEQTLAGLLPDAEPPLLDRWIVEKFRLHPHHAITHFRIVLKVVGQQLQRFLQLGADGMIGIFRHLGDQLVEPVDDLVGQSLVEPGPTHYRSRALVHHVADQMLVGGQRAVRPADGAIDQRHVPPLGHRGVERLPQHRGHVHLAQLTGERRFDHAAEAFLIERFEQVGDQSRCAAPQPPLLRRRRHEPPNGAGHVHAPHPPRDDGRYQEVGAQERCQRVADAILVTRHDRGMRDRQTERMAEQRGNGEPVSQAADHCRFGEGAQIAEPRMLIDQRPRDEIERRHHDQQSSRDDPHPHQSRWG